MRRLSAFRRDRLERELRAYFVHTPVDLQSNFAPIANLALTGVRTSGGRPHGDDVAIMRLASLRHEVRDHAKVKRALDVLSAKDREVLSHAYGASTLAREVHVKLGETAAVALLTKAAADGCMKASGVNRAPSRDQIARWLLTACIRGDAAALHAVIEQRDKLLEEALVAYDEARREDEEDDGMGGERLYGWKEIADRLGVTVRTAIRYTKLEEGRLPVFKDLRSGKVFIELEKLEAWRERGIVQLSDDEGETGTS